MTVKNPKKIKNINCRIDWDRVVIDVKNALSWFTEQGIKPTLRTMFYRLVSLEIIPNTKNSYKSLSKICVNARKKGLLPWDAFVDEGRYIVTNDTDCNYQTPEEIIENVVDYLKSAHKIYKVPRWHGQKNYVEIWIEKQALADTIKSFLGDREVNIAVNKGFAGWSFIYDNCKRLQKIKIKGKSIHILYMGDFDPSGDDMDRHLDRALSYFGLDDIDFQRVAVTQEQIEKYNLPPVPNSHETLDKVSRDTRTNGFIKKYGKLYVVELDALLAIVPKEFKIMVQGLVDKFFEEDIYKLEFAKHSPERIKRLVRKKVRFVDDNDGDE